MGKTLLIGQGYIGTELQNHIDVLDQEECSERDADTIILLGGHSSVAMCNREPEKAWDNNVTYFTEILDRLRDDQRLIYASSASVYHAIPDRVNEDCNIFNLGGMYDLTKHTIDNLSKVYNKHTYGLRFATVNGHSDVLRVDVMLNKMVHDIKTKGVIEVANKDLSRPILGIQDLCRAIKTIVDSPDDNRGIYNLASFSMTVGDMAERVVKIFGGEIEYLPDTPHYVFDIDTTRFEQTYNFKFKEDIDSILNSLEQDPKETVVRL